MHEEANGGIRKLFTEHLWEEHQVIVIHPNDVPVLIRRNDSICEAFVNGDILLVRSGFVEGLGFRRVWDGIVKTWPKDLVAELVVTTRELCVWNPNRKRLILVFHPPFHVTLQAFLELVGIRSEGSDPQFLAETITDAIHSILETTVAMGVRLDMPWLRVSKAIFAGTR